MRYVAIDLETTGLDPRDHQVLQAALVVEDTAAPDVPVEALPTFECLVSHDYYVGEATALALNREVLAALDPRGWRFDGGVTTTHLRGRRVEVLDGGAWEARAVRWLAERGFSGTQRATAAGQNAASFDLRFLRGPLALAFDFRVLDLASLFYDPARPRLPSLAEVKQRVGIATPVLHDALEDARDVLRVLRARERKPR